MASDSETGGTPTSRGLGTTDVVLPLALLVALSVSIVDLVAHWIANPWARYSIVFLPLVVQVARHEDFKRRHPRLGAVMIVAAVTTQLFSVMADTLALSRPALVVAMIGLLINRGWASKRCALLSVFIVPIPYSIASELLGVEIAEWWMSTVAGMLGIEHAIDRHVFYTGGGNANGLEVASTFAGLPLITLAVGLAGYAALRLRRSLESALRSLAFWIGALIPAQFVALALAVGLLDRFGPGAASLLLDQLVWIAAAAVIIVQTERSARGASRSPGRT